MTRPLRLRDLRRLWERWTKVRMRLSSCDAFRRMKNKSPKGEIQYYGNRCLGTPTFFKGLASRLLNNAAADPADASRGLALLRDAAAQGHFETRSTS